MASVLDFQQLEKCNVETINGHFCGQIAICLNFNLTYLSSKRLSDPMRVGVAISNEVTEVLGEIGGEHGGEVGGEMPMPRGKLYLCVGGTEDIGEGGDIGGGVGKSIEVPLVSELAEVMEDTEAAHRKQFDKKKSVI